MTGLEGSFTSDDAIPIILDGLGRVLEGPLCLKCGFIVKAVANHQDPPHELAWWSRDSGVEFPIETPPMKDYAFTSTFRLDYKSKARAARRRMKAVAKR